jgi:hypothetical protein
MTSLKIYFTYCSFTISFINHQIKHPIFQTEYEGSGEYTKEIHGEYVWDITMDTAERLVLSDHKAVLYQLIVLSQ